MFVEILHAHGIDQKDIGIMTPYIAQVWQLKKNLKLLRNVRIDTVEGFQGDEKLVMIFSAVKTESTLNRLKPILTSQHINIALSRARLVF